MIEKEEIARIQEQLGQIALAARRIDLDAFIEACDAVASPQALAAGLSTGAVTSAGMWSGMARLLKPFRDDAVSRLGVIQQELEDREELVFDAAACPVCGERRMDYLAIQDDESVDCQTCGKRYQLPQPEAC